MGTIKIFNTSRNECFSVIILPDNNQKILILWCNIQTISTLGYSKNYLCSSFKYATNQTIVNYANEQKIREVQSQLVFSNKTITEISGLLGFSDQSYLTKLFKKYLNTTPTEFRKRYHI